jgi:hypothetical protein
MKKVLLQQFSLISILPKGKNGHQTIIDPDAYRVPNEKGSSDFFIQKKLKTFTNSRVGNQ